MAEATGLALGGVAVIVVIQLIARRTGLPAAVLLVLAGIAYAWLPGPNVTLQPRFVLDVIIPPLLYSAALNSSATALRRNARTVVSLSVALVIATAVAVGFALHAVAAGVSLSAAIALGAAVAPPDPVAALAIGRRAGLPPRLITIVEGEGLLNDATALTLFEVAVASAVSGGFSLAHSAVRLLVAVLGGLVAGLTVAIVLAAIRRRINDSLADNAISLGTPFAAYLLAQSFGGSGVLAVVVAGLWFGHRAGSVQSGQSRLQSRSVWSLVEFGLEGFVFLLIGQQLRSVVAGLSAYSTGSVVSAAVASVGVVLVLRPIWLIVSERLPARLHTRLSSDAGADTHRHLSAADVVALSWSGTRGVITLAAASSLPLTIHGGRAFPERSLLLFCAYLVVVVTLVGQGLSYSPLLRRLRFRHSEADEAIVRNQARATAVRAALNRLNELVEAERLSASIAEPLRESAQRRLDRYNDRIDRLSGAEDGALPGNDEYLTAVRVRQELIEAERAELLLLRDAGRLPDKSLRVLQSELDHEEGLLPRAPSP